jgi:site-specific DNA-cytosine methylase
VVFVVHSAKDRYLNIREHMALMGLPHDYKVDDTVIKG